jgi:hypothetical protein
MKRLLPIVLLFLAVPASAEEIRIATYNIENFQTHFQAHRMTTQPINNDPVGKELVSELRKVNDEDNWEIAQVITDPKFNPDILVIEEGCDFSDLSYFNRQWLKEAYETVLVFPNNSGRVQNLCLLAKPGFKIVQKADKYYMDPDPAGGNERGARLFARGPAFVKVRSPGGYLFWVGVTHQKSKNVGAPPPGGGAGAGNADAADTKAKQLEATNWRLREATRTHQIIKELEQAGPPDVMLLGDMNDDVGMDAAEKAAGADAIATLVGPVADGLVLATQPLVDAKKFSYGGYWRDRYRELIDHIVVTKSMKDQIEEVRIVDEGLAKVASDHFPVMIRIKAH